MRNLAYSSTSPVSIYNKTSLTLISSGGESSLQSHFPATITLAIPSANWIGNKLLWLLPLIFLFLGISRLIRGCFSAGVPGKIVVDDEGANSLCQGKKSMWKWDFHLQQLDVFGLLLEMFPNTNLQAAFWKGFVTEQVFWDERKHWFSNSPFCP